MLRIAQLVLALLVALPNIGFQHSRRTQSQRNRVPTIESFTSSRAMVDLCPMFPGGSCSHSGTIVNLKVTASDPDNDSLNYKYSVSSGVIGGAGADVRWDLTEARRLGMQIATVEVSDQRGGKTSSVVRVELVVCGSCDFPCPTLNVSCPASVNEGECAVFEAFVGAGEPDRKLTYLWSHSNGQRLPGQEGAKLRIKAVGSAGDVIQATVTVLGLDPACSRKAFCETRIEKLIH